MIHPKQSYLDLFQVGESQLDTLVAEALRHGGDYCDLYFENTTYGNLTLRDGIVNAAGRHIDYGVGIRVLCGEKTGYAYAESTVHAVVCHGNVDDVHAVEHSYVR